MNPAPDSGQASARLEGAAVRWCLAYAGLLAVVTSLPYLAGAAMADPSWDFSGFVLAVEDGNSYIAKMRLGQQGEWLFRSPYSTAPQRGVLAFLPYIVLGKLSDGTHAQLVALFHLLRLAAIPLLVLSIYQFSGVFVASAIWRRWITLLATSGGGLGWLLVALGRSGWLGSLPLEFFSPETFGFLALVGFPHLILARAGMLWGFTLYLTKPRGWAAGAVLLAAGILHSPVLVPALAALGAHQLALLFGRRSQPAWRRQLAAVLLFLAPLIAYLTVAFASDPYLQGWAAQNRIRSPHPLHYLLAYGAVLPAAVLGARTTLQAADRRGLFPLAWALALPLLAYAPVNLQRRLTEGGWIALLILAVVGLAGATDRRARWARLGLAGLLLPSSLLLIAGSLANLRPPSEPIYRPAQQVAVFDWLAANGATGSVVLAGFQTSNALPAWAPMTVVAGHGPESVGLAELTAQIHNFYSQEGSEAGRRALLHEHRVDYVFWGSQERGMDGWRPADWDCLELVYRRGGVELYSVCGD